MTSPGGFQLQSLPPTLDDAKFHSYRAYLQVQQWLGNDAIMPTNWSWRRIEGQLLPIEKESDVVPERVLRLLTCGCKTKFVKWSEVHQYVLGLWREILQQL